MAAEGDCQSTNEIGGGTAIDRLRPEKLGHLDGEGNEQHRTGHHRRVEDILPKAAKGLLGQHDGNQRANGSDPPGRPRWQGHGQQPAGQDARAIEQMEFHRFARHLETQSLSDEGRRHRNQKQIDRGPAKLDKAEQGGGQQRHHDEPHGAGNTGTRVGKWSGCDVDVTHAFALAL